MFRRRKNPFLNKGLFARSAADFVIGTVKKKIGIAPRKKHRPSQQTRIYAKLAREAYQGQDRVAGVTQQRGKPVYKYSPEFSTDEEAVYFTENEAVFSIRGTANKKDIVTDLNLGIGQLSSTARAKSTREHFKKLLDSGAFGDRRIVVVGHSLGGSLTNMIGEEFDHVVAETHAFNPGGSLRRESQDLFSRKRKREQKRNRQAFEHYIEADPIGAMARHQSNNIVEIYDQLNTDLNVHTIDNFF